MLQISLQSDGKSPLIVAAQCGHENIVEFLVLQEADVLHAEEHGKTALDYVINELKNFQSLSEETLVSMLKMLAENVLLVAYT